MPQTCERQTGSSDVRLMAVRSAAFPLLSHWNPRSEQALRSLAETEVTEGSLRRLADDLADRLYFAVKSVTSASDRQRLIDLKRDVFNLRSIKGHLKHERRLTFHDELCRYEELLGHRDALQHRAADDIVSEIRSHVNALLDDPLLRCCLDYAVPRLLRTLDRKPNSAKAFSKTETTIYGYLARLFSKANPYFVYSSIALTGVNSKPECEVMIDVSVLRKIEQHLLQEHRDSSRTFVGLRPQVAGTPVSITFIVPGISAWRRITMQRSELIDRLLDCFAGGPGITLQSLRTRLAASAVPVSMAQVDEWIDKLSALGVLTLYLIRNDDDFASELSGYTPSVDELVATISEIHLKSVTLNEVPGCHRMISSLRLPWAQVDCIGYFINRYSAADFSAAQKIVDEVIATSLAAIKPLLNVSSNFTGRSAALSAYIATRLKSNSSQTLPFTELVSNLVARDWAEMPTSRAIASRFPLDDYEGTLSAEECGRLIADNLPLFPSAAPDLCVNGVFDLRSRLFFISNVFPGGERYQCRFRRYTPAGGTEPDPDVDVVQLIAPWKRNRSYVPAVLRHGCSFDPRFCHLFERWIDPSVIDIQTSGERVIYLDRSTGRRLLFRHYGLLLADLLPIAYQLLLIGQADSFSLGKTREAQPEGFQFYRGLHFGNICVRRDQWVASARWLMRLGRGDSFGSLRALRNSLHTATGCKVDHWYYALPRAGKSRLKPAYLDLANPLSAAVYTQHLLGCSDGDVVEFAPMIPSPADLPDGYVTEWMIQV